MQWQDLTTEDQLSIIDQHSTRQPVIIFKHSTRCSISHVAKNRLDNLSANPCDFYYLDLLRYRSISNKIAEHYDVHHESPQALLIVNGECVYEESHNGITAQDIESEIKEWKNKIDNNKQ